MRNKKKMLEAHRRERDYYDFIEDNLLWKLESDIDETLAKKREQQAAPAAPEAKTRKRKLTSSDETTAVPPAKKAKIDTDDATQSYMTLTVSLSENKPNLAPATGLMTTTPTREMKKAEKTLTTDNFRMPGPTISYIWIGDPPRVSPMTSNTTYSTSASATSSTSPDNTPASKLLTSGVVGHDIQAPILMGEKVNVDNHNQVIFWCLDQHVPYYRSRLSKHHVEVRSIQSYLREQSLKNETKEAANKTITVMNELLRPERNTVRDRVTAKEIFSLFLLMNMGDYVIDSNVRPSTNQALYLTRYDEFHIPLLYKNGVELDADVWAMFSPPENNQVASIAFNKFYDGWLKCQEVYAYYGNSASYYLTIRQLIGDSVEFAMKQGANAHWRADTSADHHVSSIDEIGITKYYFNTHDIKYISVYETEDSLLRNDFSNSRAPGLKLFSTETKNLIYDYLNDDEGKRAIRTFNPKRAGTPYIFMLVYTGRTERIKELIDLKADINQQMTTGETPLHAAIERRKLDVVEMLLKHGARVDLSAKYDDKPKKWKAYDLIQKIPPAERKPYLDLYEQYSPQLQNKLRR